MGYLLMKSTGIVRPLDPLGRVVIPKPIRNQNGMDYQTPIEIFVDGDRIILKVYKPSCVVCGNSDSVSEFRKKRICDMCRIELRDMI